MNRLSHLLAVALCVALSAQLAAARIQITSAAGNIQPVNTRAPDSCAQDYFFNAINFAPALVPNVNLQSCANGLSQSPLSSTIVAPTTISNAQYSNTATFPVTITGTDFDDLFAEGAAPAAATAIGTVCLADAGATVCPTACVIGAAGTPTPRTLSYVSPTQLTFNIRAGATPDDWLTPAILLENTPRLICFAPAAAATTLAARVNVPLFTGFHFGAVYGCATSANCGTALQVTGTGLDGLQEINRRLIQGLTQCCQGQCINPNVQGCCGTAGTPFELTAERCCNGVFGTVSGLDGNCPCRRQGTGATPVCPNDQPVCCFASKFAELVPTNCAGTNPSPSCFTQTGSCFNPNTQRCCDTGAVYNPGSSQCCSINGVQSNDVPCPCQQDLDCQGGSTQGGVGAIRTRNYNQRCCVQSAPATNPVDGAVCSAYQNFPSGTIAARATRCSGVCFDERYQICCNGAVCVRQFEKCCNTTCCNVFTSFCSDSGRRASVANVPSNYREFATLYYQCTTVENLETVSVFWVYIVPAGFLISTLASLALTLVFTAKAAVRMFSFLEKMIIAMGIIITVVSGALYFSPVYKYGIVFAISAMIAIVAAAARVRWVTVVALVAVGLSVWYLLDPWHGNDYLTLAYWRLPNGNVDPRTAGLFSTLDSLWPQRGQITDGFKNMCVRYYNYFLYDPLLQDQTRFNNPNVPTFGYCTRGWITALLVLAGVLWASLVFLFALLVLALILRFRKDRSAPIELEVRPEPFLVPAQYGAMPFVAQDPYLAAPFVPVY